jgi:hypothetical protein
MELKEGVWFETDCKGGPPHRLDATSGVCISIDKTGHPSDNNGIFALLALLAGCALAAGSRMRKLVS